MYIIVQILGDEVIKVWKAKNKLSVHRICGGGFYISIIVAFKHNLHVSPVTVHLLAQTSYEAVLWGIALVLSDMLNCFKHKLVL